MISQNPAGEEIRSIFSPRANFIVYITDKSYENIADDIQKGIFTLNREYVELQELDLPPKKGSETDNHRLLKANGAKILSDMGETKVIFEGFDNSDVFGDELKIRVECGHTDGVRLYRSLWYVSEFWVFQFPKNSVSELYKFHINYTRLIELEPQAKKIVPKSLMRQWIDVG